MLIVLLSWIYILAVCLLAGCAAIAMLERIFPLGRAHTLTGLVTTGAVVLTVYAEYWSLFAGVGALCHFLMLMALVVCLRFSQRTQELVRDKCVCLGALLRTHTGLFLLCLVIFLAFYTSRGNFHTDTGIYHAAAIRWNEEYGVVKGLANIDQHYGYNSAYLLFCSLFTFSWIPGIGATAGGNGTLALHTTTGFLAALYLCYACRHLRTFFRHESHLGDAARFGLILYVFTNATGLMSPATDYGTLLVSGYIACAWLDVYENGVLAQRRDGERLHAENPAEQHTVESCLAEQRLDAQRSANRHPDTQVYEYGLLSMLALFSVSMKLSCAAMFLLVLYPLVVLIRHREWREIGQFVLMGVVLFIPFVIRNVILSGWLFYPFEGIDLFNVAWKVPYEYSKVDSDQIKVWGRCLYDITLSDLSIREWLPTWWEGQSDYGQMLLYGVVLSPVLFVIDLILAIAGRVRLHAEYVLYVVMLYGSVVLWFLTAPFIRYGLTFLLLLPILPVFWFGDLCMQGSYGKSGICKVPGLFVAGAILVCLCAWIDHYATDDLSFVKQHLRDPYYISQQPFDTRDEEALTVENEDGSASETIYTAGEDSVNSYYAFPGTCYDFMTERTMLMGDTIEDGFMASPNP